MTADIVELHAGQFVWYMKPGQPIPLPAKLISDGICESKKQRNGTLTQYAHLMYGTANPKHILLGFESAPIKTKDQEDTARAVSERQTHEVTAPWDPSGLPGTWHLPGEAEQIEHPKPNASMFQQVAAMILPSDKPKADRPKLRGPDD